MATTVPANKPEASNLSPFTFLSPNREAQTDFHIQTRQQGNSQVPASFADEQHTGEKEEQEQLGRALSQQGTTTRLVNELQGVYDTANGVHIAQQNPLPWEMDKQGKLFSTDADKMQWQIKWLRTALNVKEEGEVKVTAEMRPAYFAQLAKLEMERATMQEEKSFRNRLMTWVLGDGPPEEYNRCWWIEDPKKAEDRKKMLRDFPQIAQGMVEKSDLLPLKTKLFLDELYRKPPTNDVENYLWYKHIIKQNPVNFDYLFMDSSNMDFWNLL